MIDDPHFITCLLSAAVLSQPWCNGAAPLALRYATREVTRCRSVLVGVDHGSARRFEVQARRSLPQQITIIHRVMTFSLPRCIMTRLRIPLNWLQEGLQTAALHLTANQLPHCCLRTAAELFPTAVPRLPQLRSHLLLRRVLGLRLQPPSIIRINSDA